ncbi:MAG TPA: hypothetical protein VMW40_04250 [Candidatus Bathyarchaeia archaeon]|nr:hypothetical protein [Candidatus Bathyarchaeia archaeon]
MPLSKSSLTSLTKRRMIAMANKGRQPKPYCTVPAVAEIHDDRWR